MDRSAVLSGAEAHVADASGIGSKRVYSMAGSTAETLVRSGASRTFDVLDMTLSRVWHCFGNHTHRVSLNDVEALLDASGSNVLPINTHELRSRLDRSGLMLGYGDATYDALCARRDTRAMVKMINVNLQTDPRSALSKAQVAHEMTGERILKLEVLTPDLGQSNDRGLVEATRMILDWNPQMIVMPLLSTNPSAAADLVALGCPLLRVMGGPIGSRTGIQDAASFAELCRLPVPVCLDGGVGSSRHFHDAIALGAEAVLINSMLFSGKGSPVAIMREFIADAFATVAP